MVDKYCACENVRNVRAFLVCNCKDSNVVDCRQSHHNSVYNAGKQLVNVINLFT
jgi:hypothetical protein